MRRLALVLLVLAGLTACGDDADTAEDFDTPETTVGQDLPEGVVVFNPDQVESDGYGEATDWTPTAEDVVAAEDLLRAYLDDHPDLGLDDFDTYHRQYVGIGESLSVNALCESSGLDDWEDEFIVVADGGTCFWSAHVTVPTAQVTDVVVNGFA
jgi:hypothetical protein